MKNRLTMFQTQIRRIHSENATRLYPTNCARIHCICCPIISRVYDGSNPNIVCLVAYCYWNSDRDGYGTCTYDW